MTKAEEENARLRQKLRKLSESNASLRTFIRENRICSNGCAACRRLNDLREMMSR